GRVIDLWDLSRGEEPAASPALEAEVRALAFFPDGRTLAALEEGRVRFWCAEGETLVPVGRAVPAPGPSPRLALTPRGRLLLTSGPQDELQVRDAETGTLRSRLPGPYGGTAVFSPADDRLACLDRDGGLAVVDPGNWSARRFPGGPLGVVRSLAFTPDG